MTTSEPVQITTAVPAGTPAIPGLGIIEPAGGKPARLATLVGRNLIALAKHYTPPAGAQIAFLTGWGTVNTVIQDVVKTYGDLLIMRLRDTVDDKVQVAQFADLEEIGVASTYLAVGLDASLTRPVFAYISPPRTVYATGKNAKFIQDGKAAIQPGDSGAPIFVKVGSKFKLFGTNYGITPREFYSNLGALYADYIPQL